MQSFFTMTTKSSKLQGMFFHKAISTKKCTSYAPLGPKDCVRLPDPVTLLRIDAPKVIFRSRKLHFALETTRRIDTVYYPSGAKTDLKPERSVVFIRSSKLHFQWSSRSRNTRKIDTAYCHSGAKTGLKPERSVVLHFSRLFLKPSEVRLICLFKRNKQV